MHLLTHIFASTIFASGLVLYSQADPCRVNFGGCDKDYGLCWGTGERTHYCSCKAGFKPVNGNASQCTDINECLEEDVCDMNALCENTYGSYVCTCRCGYVKDYTGQRCLDASLITDMCMVPRLCYHEFLWLSTWFDQTPFDTKYGKRRYLPDPYSGMVRIREPIDNKNECACEKGYEINKCGYCEDIDECKLYSHLCSGHAMFCVNTEGSYYCQCDTSFILGPCRKRCYRDSDEIPLICEDDKVSRASAAKIDQSLPSFNAPYILYNFRTCKDGVVSGETTEERYDVDKDGVNDLKLTWTCTSRARDSSNRSTSTSELINYAVEEARWGPWSCWTCCKATCWGGLQTRVRKCLHGRPGITGCEGAGSDKRECYKGRKCAFRTRKDIKTLTPAEIEDLLQAMERFKSDMTVKGFHNSAAAHGWPFQCNRTTCCPHGSKMKFLTWHRLLTLNFEMGLSRYLKDKTLGIPYWNWLAEDKYPPDIIWKKVLNGEENPFANFTVLIDRDGPMRTIQRDEDIFQIPLIFANETWKEVTSTLMKSYIMHAFSESLESCHGGGHVAACGKGRQTTTCQISMTVLTFAAFDPFFMFHHSQTDRLWAVAQKKMEDTGTTTWSIDTALEALEEEGDFGKRQMPFGNKTLNSHPLLNAVNTIRDSYYHKELMGVQYDNLENDGYPGKPRIASGKLLVVSPKELLFVAQHFQSVEKNVYINYYTVFEDVPCEELIENDRIASTILLGTDVPYRNGIPNLVAAEKLGDERLDLDLNIKACYTYSPECKEKCPEVKSDRLSTMPDPSLIFSLRNQFVEIHKFNWTPGKRTSHWPITIAASRQWIFFYGTRAGNVTQVESARAWSSCNVKQGRAFRCSISKGGACILPIGNYYLVDSDPRHCNNGLKMIILSRN